MAISWGAWEYAGGNGMRAGIDVSWSAVTNASTSVKATVKYYAQNQYSYSYNNASASFGGSITGSVLWDDVAGAGATILIATRTYTYNYSTYGSSPASRTFSLSISGLYNGVTPSASVSSAIPARPYAGPNATSSCGAAYISDTQIRVSWVNNSTAGKPWNSVWLEQQTDGGSWVQVTSSISGSATTYTAAVSANHRYAFRVRADNTIATSGYSTSGNYWTTPGTPTITTALTAVTGPPVGQRISWAENGFPTNEFQTDVIAYKDGVSVGVVGTVAQGTLTFDHTTANAVSAYTVSNRWKYAVRHRTTSGAVSLASPYTGYTAETPGTTTPPLAPTGLQPSGINVDPSVAIRLSWVFQPGQVGDTQTAYTVSHRLQGTTTWTTVTNASTSQFYDIPANTYAESNTIEWMVATKGADPAYGPAANSVSFLTAIVVIAPDPVKIPLQLDLFSGRVEAATSMFEQRDFMQRIQSQLLGGGNQAVDGSFNVSWSNRWLAMGLGGSDSTFTNGEHDIENPFGWNASQKSLTSNLATITVAANTMRMRVGDTIVVNGVGAPFDTAAATVRATTTNTVSYDCVSADVATTSATGQVFPCIQGHGGAGNRYNSSAKINLASGEGLYYALPFGWGSGTTPRKNGVTKIVTTSLTSNVATFTTQSSHFYAIGDRINITGCGAPYDGFDRVVTGIGQNTFTVAITNANVGANSPASALGSPSGKDTFFNNFHVVGYTADFVVPSNWILLAFHNPDSNRVEWINGQSISPSSDSVKQVARIIGVKKLTTQHTALGDLVGCTWSYTPPVDGIARIQGRYDVLAGYTTGNLQIQLYRSINGGAFTSVGSENQQMTSGGGRQQISIDYFVFPLTAGNSYTFKLTSTSLPSTISIQIASSAMTYDFTPGAVS